jgi:hypothetical protein
MPITSNRRRFLGLMGTTFAAPVLFAQEQSEPKPTVNLIDSPPVLQCPTENSITVVWAVGQPAAGFVQFGTSESQLDQTAYGETFGLNPYNDRFLQVRIEELKPNTRYFYRTVTRSFRFVHAYKFEQSEPVQSSVYSFETPSAESKTGSFAVINDTHSNQETLKVLAAKLSEIKSDYTVWNGDLVNSYDNADVAVASILRPGDSEIAAERPLLFVPGNHDYRGAWARNIPLCLPAWNHPAPADRTFGRNFVVRKGSLALIGLDTGEDKPDNRSEWGGLARFEPYRVAQRDWLARALKSPAVASAPFVAAFCHIPLFDSNPNANGGDLPEGFAAYQRQAADLWGPLLTQYGVQLVVAAHVHQFRFDPATSDRTWAQVTGGGQNLTRVVTLIHGKVEGDALEVVVDSVSKNEELGHWTFPKRRNIL